MYSLNQDSNSLAALTLTIPEAARLLGISTSKAYEAARAGEIPTRQARDSSVGLSTSTRGVDRWTEADLVNWEHFPGRWDAATPTCGKAVPTS